MPWLRILILLYFEQFLHQTVLFGKLVIKSACCHYRGGSSCSDIVQIIVVHSVWLSERHGSRGHRLNDSKLLFRRWWLDWEAFSADTATIGLGKCRLIASLTSSNAETVESLAHHRHAALLSWDRSCFSLNRVELAQVVSAKLFQFFVLFAVILDHDVLTDTIDARAVHSGLFKLCLPHGF